MTWKRRRFSCLVGARFACSPCSFSLYMQQINSLYVFLSPFERLKVPPARDLLNGVGTLFAFAALISSARSHCAAMPRDHRWLQTMNYSVCKLSKWNFDQKTPTFRRSKSAWWSLRMNIAWNLWPWAHPTTDFFHRWKHNTSKHETNLPVVLSCTIALRTFSLESFYVHVTAQAWTRCA